MRLRELVSLFPAYCLHFLHAVDDHSLQSPFLFHLYQEIVKKNNGKGLATIEQIRRRLRKEHSFLQGADRGAGSRVKTKSAKSIARIAKFSLSPPFTAHLLYLLVKYFQPEFIVELGTSLGITSLYLAEGSKKATVYTFEGNHAIAAKAREIFEQAGTKNIHLIEGNIDDTLPHFISDSKKHVDFFFIDANHRGEALMKYLNGMQPILSKNAVIVVDDIRWSSDMYKSWKEIVRSNVGHIYIDMLYFGLILRNENLTPGHFYW